MDENVIRVLQMLQEGKISAQEAETLIAALRGETAAPEATAGEAEKGEAKEDKSFLGGFDFDKIKAPKVDFESLGDKISKAVGRVQPEKIVKRVQTQLRTVTRAGAHWGTTVSTRMKTWNEGEDTRPVNKSELPEHSESHEQEYHLAAEASVLIDNPLGDVKVTGVPEGPAVVIVRKTGWSARAEDAKAVVARMDVTQHGTDAKLEVKVTAPDLFREGVVDIEVRVPHHIALVRVNSRFGTTEIAEIAGQAEAVTTTGKLDLHDLAGDVRGETASGDLTVRNVSGAAKVATQSGDITAENIGRGLWASAASGDVTAAGVEGGAAAGVRAEVKSVSGDVSLERAGLAQPMTIAVESISGDATLKDAAGSISLKAVSGDVKAEGIVASRLQAQTVSGDVQLRLRAAFSDTMQVNTVSGDVTIGLPLGSNVRVSLATSSGELRCEHDAHDVTATETLWSGQIGTGSGTLNVQTISGDTHILHA